MFAFIAAVTMLPSAADASACIPLSGVQANACRRLEQILPFYPDQCSISSWLLPHCSACGQCSDTQRAVPDFDVWGGSFESFDPVSAVHKSACIPLSGAQANACSRLEQILPLYPDQCSISNWLLPHCSACGHCSESQRAVPDFDVWAADSDAGFASGSWIDTDNLPWAENEQQLRCRSVGMTCRRGRDCCSRRCESWGRCAW
jgi:hypothetical protein